MRKKQVFLILILFIIILSAISAFSYTGKNNKVKKEEIISQNTKTKEKDTFVVDTTMVGSEEYVKKNINQIKYKTSKEKRDKYLKENLKKIGALDNENIAIYYKSLVDGYEFSQNIDQFFIAASTTKIVYCMEIERIEKSTENILKKELTYHDRNFQDGGGNITIRAKNDKEKIGTMKPLKNGDKIPLYTVIYEMIVKSDNTALGMIRENYPTIRNDIKNYSNPSYYNSEENMVKPIFFKDVLMKLYKDDGKYKNTFEFMKNAKDYWNVLPSNSIFIKKYGWYKDTISQVGIAYEKRPYMIIIFDKGNGYIDEKKPTIVQYIGKVIYDTNNLE